MRSVKEMGLRVTKLRGGDGREFGFGGDHAAAFLGTWLVPIWLAGRQIVVELDVVEGKMPLLLSLETMGKAYLTIATHEKKVLAPGSVEVRQGISPAGHIVLSVLDTPSGCGLAARLLEEGTSKAAGMAAAAYGGGKLRRRDRAGLGKGSSPSP